MHARLVYIPAVPPPKDHTENTLFIFFSRLLFLCMFVNFVRTQEATCSSSCSPSSCSPWPSSRRPSRNLANYKGEEDIATGKTLDADTGKVTEFRVRPTRRRGARTRTASPSCAT